MKKFLVPFAALLFLGSMPRAEAVTFNINGEIIADSSGAAAPTTTLFVLVADTLNDGFAGPSAGDFLGGSADDFIIATLDLSAFATAGVLSDTTGNVDFTADSSGNWDASDPVKAFWYPNLSLSGGAPSATPSAGEEFGMFTSATGQDGGDAWVTPAAGTVTLNMYSSDAAFLNVGGANAPAGLQATMNVIPEPSTALFTSLGFGMLLLRRRR